MARPTLLILIGFCLLVGTQQIVGAENTVSLNWYNAGTGCFHGNWYKVILTDTIQECLQRCQDELYCALVRYFAKQKKCSFSRGEYTRKASCTYQSEIVVKDINECAVTVDICKDRDAYCVNTLGSYKCTCRGGYYKPPGETCTEVPYVEWIEHRNGCFEYDFFRVRLAHTEDECKLICQVNEQCVLVEYRKKRKKCKLAKQREFKHTKACKYKTDIFIKAKMECGKNERRCKHFAYCHAIGKHRVCKCNLGYTGDGKKCEDINECATYEDLCDLNGKCVNTVGSFKCLCNKGYHGDGKRCRKDKIKKQDLEEVLEKDSNTFRSIINMFHNSGSSQGFSLVSMLFGFLVACVVRQLYA